MALCKILSCPLATPFWHCCANPLIKNEAATFKNFKLNYNRGLFTTSLLKERRWLTKSKNKVASKESVFLENLKAAAINNNSYSILLKPFVFTVAFCGVCFAGTAIWHYENLRKKALLFLQKNWLTDRLIYYEKKRFTLRQKLNKMWSQLTEGEKIFVPICLINMLVFLAWRINRILPVMNKYFYSSPFNESVCLPMLLSTFSHHNIIHLSFNMYALYSFSSIVVADLGKEQFLGLYLAGGVISSFTSYLHKVARSHHFPSLGASGAIMAVVGYICVKHPDSKLALVFLPSLMFSAGSAIKCIIGMDLMGVLCNWKFLDHAAHLGGSMCGIGYCLWGNTYIWQKREPLVQLWQEIRSSK